MWLYVCFLVWIMEENPGLQQDYRNVHTCFLTLDPNTANSELSLSEENRKVAWVGEKQPYPEHPDRFDVYPQIYKRFSSQMYEDG
ncbi:hypothetical protein cypCar_00045107 [Cyprinus carpio]|nr:hypothetical protein cypCar_00045107 [Cyprinus carpio]